MKNQPLPFVLCDDTLTVILNNGESHSIKKGHANFNDVMLAIRNKEWDKVPDLISTKAAIVSFSNGKFEVVNNEIKIDGEPVSQLVQNKIFEYMESGLPYEPIVNFWRNLNKNPSFRAVNQLYSFMLKYNHALTEDGCFIAYKKVKEDFTDVYTGTIPNNVGSIVSIPRNKVDENPEATCSHGLHVACFEYANSFYSGQNLLMVKVNPKDVVSIPVDCNEGKIRVCEYEVLSVVDREDNSKLYKTNECNVCSCNHDNYDDEEDDDDDYQQDIDDDECYPYDDE